MKVKKNSKKSKTNYKLFFIILAITIPLTIVITLLGNPNSLKRIKGDISPHINAGIKTYEVGDFVYFDPVKYELCDEDQTSETCFRWMVVNKNGDSYDLFMLNHDSNISWTGNNPKSIIESATSSWSDKLTVDSSYDVQVTDTFKLDFSTAKARLLLKSEYDNLPNTAKDALKNYCSAQKNIVKQWGYSFCGLLDTENRVVGQINPGGYVSTFNFDSMATGSSLGSNTTARPVVHITMNDDLGNKDFVVKTVYNPGDIVYYDPVSEDECKETVYDEAKVNLNQSTCYKWRVLSTDDTDTNEILDIQLDHNIANYRWNQLADLTEEENNRICAPDQYHNCTNEEYYSEGYTTPYINNQAIGPRAALTKLAEATSTWTRVPLLNYEYDTSNAKPKPEWNMLYSDRFNYGLLKCVEGTCTTSLFDLTMATGLRARMITADEIAAITRKELPDLEPVDQLYRDEIANVWTQGSGMSKDNNSGRYSFSTSNSPINSKKLSWLLENTSSYSFGEGYSGSTGFGSNSGSFIPGVSYYTMTPIADGYGNSYIWLVYEDGFLSYTPANLSNYGIRPVIQYRKEIPKVTVTYNDEDRITTRTININSLAEEIDSQGKEGHTFKFWSLDRTNAYDFNTPVSEDITLYAVYEINKFNVDFYDNDEKIGTQIVSYNNKVNTDYVPIVSKEGYDFKYWSEDKTTEFDFNTNITRNYSLYSVYEEKEEPEEECILSISSKKYSIDKANKTINNVPEKASIKEIEENLDIQAKTKTITDKCVTIKCDDKEETYTINRVKILSTGQLRTRYGIIVFLLIIITGLLVVARKKSVELKSMIK